MTQVNVRYIVGDMDAAISFYTGGLRLPRSTCIRAPASPHSAVATCGSC